jgi:hypothetical protein
MNANTTSKWGGYGASVFTIACFCEGLAYAITEGDLPDWFGIVTGATFLLATLSGVVCLSAAMIGYFQRRRSRAEPPGGSEVRAPVAP